MIILMCLVFVFGSLVCYASCYAAAEADIENERYRREHENKQREA